MPYHDIVHIKWWTVWNARTVNIIIDTFFIFVYTNIHQKQHKHYPYGQISHSALKIYHLQSIYSKYAPCLYSAFPIRSEISVKSSACSGFSNKNELFLHSHPHLCTSLPLPPLAVSPRDSCLFLPSGCKIGARACHERAHTKQEKIKGQRDIRSASDQTICATQNHFFHPTLPCRGVRTTVQTTTYRK